MTGRYGSQRRETHQLHLLSRGAGSDKLQVREGLCELSIAGHWGMGLVAKGEVLVAVADGVDELSVQVIHLHVWEGTHTEATHSRNLQARRRGNKVAQVLATRVRNAS